MWRLVWIAVCIVGICLLTTQIIKMAERQDQEAREAYERQRAFVKVKFEIPPEHQLFINGTHRYGIVYLCSLDTYTLELRKNDVVVKCIKFKPNGQLNAMEVVKL